VIGEVLAIAAERLGAHSMAVLSRLGGVLGEEARAATTLRRAELSVLTRTPVPPALRAVHPTWI
jgi:hypothetical protein